MSARTVTVLHPGEMGASIAAAAASAGHRVLWVDEGRSEETGSRARKAGLEASGSLGAALAASDVVISVCPPHVATDVACSVAATGYAGLYVDANAVSPATTRAVGSGGDGRAILRRRHHRPAGVARGRHAPVPGRSSRP